MSLNSSVKGQDHLVCIVIIQLAKCLLNLKKIIIKTPDNLDLKKKPIDVKSGGRTGHHFDLGFKRSNCLQLPICY